MSSENDDFMEAFFGQKNDDHHPCRSCRHTLGKHDDLHGCTVCTCMATKGEARPRSDAERRRGVIGDDYLVIGYAPYNPNPAPRKDADMKTAAQIERELRALETQAETLALRKAALQEALDKRSLLPDEPEVHSVIKFRVQFDPHGVTYTFVATRTARNSSAQWYTTGTAPKHKGPFSWDDLLDLMHQDVGVKTGATRLEFFLFDESGKWVR